MIKFRLSYALEIQKMRLNEPRSVEHIIHMKSCQYGFSIVFF
jgi:hypothetical protein